jgi:hypothetical protein
MKKLIGVILIVLTLLIGVIYRHVTNHQAKAKPEAATRARGVERLRYPLLYTVLLLQ